MNHGVVYESTGTMPLLRNRTLPLRTIALRYVARNLELFWKEEWDPELQEITEASDDILLNLPSGISSEIFKYSNKNNFMNVKTLLLLLDHKTFSEDLSTPNILNELDVRYVSTLLARRCKRSTSLLLDDLSFVKDPSLGEALGTFTKLTTLRLQSTHCAIVKVIGSNLHNLKELFLVDLENDNPVAIDCLVAGCPKLKILHVGWGVTLESAKCVLLHLPNLIEFKYPYMVFVLKQIIQDDNVDRVSAIRNLYICSKFFCKFRVSDVLKTAQMVMNHLKNIMMLDLSLPRVLCEESFPTFSVTVSSMTQLTKLTWRDLSNCDITIIPIITATGHQLILLDLCCQTYSRLDVIDQCRKLRVLRITATYLDESEMTDQSYGSDLQEPITPFHHLQELHLNGLNISHFKPALFKSLIASPDLRDLRLMRIPNFTDHIVKSAFSYINDEGEQLAFTSLRKLELQDCHTITNYLENLVTHERVPLEILTIESCSLITMKEDSWNLQPFDLEF